MDNARIANKKSSSCCMPVAFVTDPLCNGHKHKGTAWDNIYAGSGGRDHKRVSGLLAVQVVEVLVATRGEGAR